MKKILISLSFVYIAFFSVKASAEFNGTYSAFGGGSPSTPQAQTPVHIFNVCGTNDEHARYGGRNIILRNSTGQNLSSYRILVMFLIDPSSPVTPGNTTQSVLQFANSDDEVVLPVDHFNFSLVVYSGNFEGSDESPLNMIREGHVNHVFMLDGEELADDTRTVRITVNSAVVDA